MAPACSYSTEEQNILLDVALEVIRYGLHHDIPNHFETPRFSNALQVPRASFVTLKLEGQLRGCIGSLEAVRPLVEDVRENAFAAAYRDPRFSRLEEHELKGLGIGIAVLSAPEPLTIGSEQDLIAQLRPGIDGLILEEDHRRGTFLPAVWESLPEPQAFLRQLKLKTGLHPDYWSSHLRVYRYHTEIIDGSQ